MLGSVADAEDIVQEVWLRWQGYNRETVTDPAAFLSTIATRLAINLARSAHSRRETYIGPWLPEPVDTSANPALGAERAEALELAVLILLEKLSPTERAAYVLREAFGVPYEQIASTIQSTEPATRKLVSRARQHLATGRRAAVSSHEHRRLLSAFLTAAQAGDVSALEKLLAEDVVSYTDGNGVEKAARTLVSGRGRVAKFVASFASHFWIGTELHWLEMNGRAAAAVTRDGEIIALSTVTASEDGIDQLLWIMSPAKLANVSLASD